jgi:anti-sigma regulatory factor (Ser/Thr protein kinase)
MCLTLNAGGVPFDPASHRTRPSPRTLEEAEPGGLGILMMRTNADRIAYERLGDANCTSFLVGWGTGSSDDGPQSGPQVGSGD